MPFSDGTLPFWKPGQNTVHGGVYHQTWTPHKSGNKTIHTFLMRIVSYVQYTTCSHGNGHILIHAVKGFIYPTVYTLRVIVCTQGQVEWETRYKHQSWKLEWDHRELVTKLDMIRDEWARKVGTSERKSTVRHLQGLSRYRFNKANSWIMRITGTTAYHWCCAVANFFVLQLSQLDQNLCRGMLDFEQLQDCGAIVCDCNVLQQPTCL